MILYKANIIFTREKDSFDIIENGYVAVDNGRVVGVSTDPGTWDRYDEIIDYGDRLLIPAMNDMHVHAPQYRNQAIAMDLELLPWLNNYTFPEEANMPASNMPSACTAVSCTTCGDSAPCAPWPSPPSTSRARACS